MGLVLDILILIALLAWAAWALVRLRRRRGPAFQIISCQGFYNSGTTFIIWYSLNDRT